jgi:hypothetical protein
VLLDANKSKSVSVEIEPTEYLFFMAFRVDGKEVNKIRRAMLAEKIEKAYGFHRIGPIDNIQKLVVSMHRRISRARRIVKFHPFSRDAGYTALVYFCGPVSFEAITPEDGRFREYTAPAELPLECHGIAHGQPITCAELDEKAAALSAAEKKRPDILEPFAGVLRKHCIMS